jgi:alpha-L-arabinofuranosidase
MTAPNALCRAPLGALVCLLVSAAAADPAAPAVLKIDAAQISARVSPTLYGLMTEEINHSYDGGIYAELVRNRTFQDDPSTPVDWTLIKSPNSVASISLDHGSGPSPELPVSLELDITAANGRVGVANGGYWGIPVKPDTLYYASFYAEAGPGFAGPIHVSIESDDGLHTWATGEVTLQPGPWRKYSLSLLTGKVPESERNRLVLWSGDPGQVWLDLVSLFPPTWDNRPNGNRIDLMQLLAAMKPAFLRLPGGNYLEGKSLETRFAWKRTIGPLIDRPGHFDSAWGYRSTDGLGLLEYLDWCEDLNMQPVLAVFDGLTLNKQTPPIPAGPALEPYVQSALDEIEYVTGDTTTRWGAVRASDGHPAPFPLTYVEVGNEDFFDRIPGSYDSRFAQFYDAIKERYPSLQVIATAPVTSRHPDLLDEHFYRSPGQMESDAGHYDHYPRNGPKIFVGEWATREGSPTPNLDAALGDAAWMTGLERNSDLVVMASYAPLFVNVNPGAMQWHTDLIGYDALHSYGSPSYYAQVIFSRYHGNVVLPVDGSAIPTRMWQPPARRRRGHPAGPRPAPRPIPTLFYDATRDTQTGEIFLKVVNTAGTAQPVRIELGGVTQVDPEGLSVVLSSARPTDTNSIADPTRVVPVVGQSGGRSADFTTTLKPYSINILGIGTR